MFYIIFVILFTLFYNFYVFSKLYSRFFYREFILSRLHEREIIVIKLLIKFKVEIFRT